MGLTGNGEEDGESANFGEFGEEEERLERVFHEIGGGEGTRFLE